MDTKSLLHLNSTPPSQVRQLATVRNVLSDDKALRETVAWCSVQHLTDVSPETEDTLRRRKLVSEANEIGLKLRKLPWEQWMKHPEWTRAQKLLSMAEMESLVLLTHQLRSPALQPPNPMWNHYSCAAVGEAVSHVVSTRSALLSKERGYTALHGRLLHYLPSENLADGAACFSSHGFFDVDNCPPWDTWVRYDGLTLVSFVPGILLPSAQQGIDANPEQWIFWAD